MTLHEHLTALSEKAEGSTADTIIYAGIEWSKGLEKSDNLRFLAALINAWRDGQLVTREEHERLREALGHAVGIIEAHVDRNALGMNGDPRDGMWPLLDEYLSSFRAALNGSN